MSDGCSLFYSLHGFSKQQVGSEKGASDYQVENRTCCTSGSNGVSVEDSGGTGNSTEKIGVSLPNSQSQHQADGFSARSYVDNDVSPQGRAMVSVIDVDWCSFKCSFANNYGSRSNGSKNGFPG